MKNDFRGFIDYTEEEFKYLWEKSIIVVDTNILLYFYKYHSRKTVNQLLDILKMFKKQGRLWIPHQVALEYFFNYESNMYKQEYSYNKFRRELDKFIDEKISETNSAILDARNNNSFIKVEDFEFLLEYLRKSKEQLDTKVKNKIDELADPKDMHEEILLLLENNIGPQYNQEKIEDIEKDGQERYKYNIPPGYEDKKEKKDDHRYYKGVRYHQMFGDLIIWKQMQDKVNTSGHETPVIFVTEDSKKDWWQRVNGKNKGPLPVLIQEFYDNTNQNFYMYNAPRFIKYASDYLGIELDDEQFHKVTEEIESIRNAEESVKISQKNSFLNNLNKFINKSEMEHLERAKIPLRKVIGYLPEHEQEQSEELLNNALHEVDDIGEEYSDAVSLIFSQAMPSIEKNAKNLLVKLHIQGHTDLAERLSKEFKELPKTPIRRVTELIKLIDKIEYYIYNDGLPF